MAVRKTGEGLRSGNFAVEALGAGEPGSSALNQPVLLDWLTPLGEKWEMALHTDREKSWGSRGSRMADRRAWVLTVLMVYKEI